MSGAAIIERPDARHRRVRQIGGRSKPRAGSMRAKILQALKGHGPCTSRTLFELGCSNALTRHDAVASINSTLRLMKRKALVECDRDTLLIEWRLTAKGRAL